MADTSGKREKSSNIDWIRLTLSAWPLMLAAVGFFYGFVQNKEKNLLQQQNQKLEAQISQAEAAVDDEKVRVDETQRQFDSLKDDPNQILLSPRVGALVRILAIEGESVETIVAKAIEFYADPPNPLIDSPLNTAPGTVLDVGERWVTGGIAVTISNPQRRSTCKDGLFEFDLKIENITGNDKPVEINGDNLSILIDGTARSNYHWTHSANARTTCEAATLSDSSGEKLVPAKRPFNIELLESADSINVYYVVEALTSEDKTVSGEKMTVRLQDTDPINGATWEVSLSDLP